MTLCTGPANPVGICMCTRVIISFCASGGSGTFAPLVINLCRKCGDMSQSSGTPCNFKSTNQEIRPGYNGLVFPGFVLWLIEVQKDIFNIGILLYHPNVCPLFKNDQWLTILEAMYFFLYKPFKSVTYNITYNVYTILQYHPCNWLFITILPILSLAAQAMPLFHRDTGTP